MVLVYMVCHGSHQYTPFMLAYIPAPWIRHGKYNMPQLQYLELGCLLIADSRGVSWGEAPAQRFDLKIGWN